MVQLDNSKTYLSLRILDSSSMRYVIVVLEFECKDATEEPGLQLIPEDCAVQGAVWSTDIGAYD
jgi:hypothetical protein